MGSVRVTLEERTLRTWPTRRIYMLWALGSSMFKIGIAAGPRRIHDIQACSPVELVLVGMRPATIRDEFRMHQSLRRYRHHGEWFNLPESEVWRVAEWLSPMIPQPAQSLVP